MFNCTRLYLDPDLVCSILVGCGLKICPLLHLSTYSNVHKCKNIGSVHFKFGTSERSKVTERTQRSL